MAAEYMPLINGREYGWADIIVTIGGMPITGIRGIKFNKSQDKENVYGASRKPVSRGYGRVTLTASITLLGSTVFGLQNGAPKGDLNCISPFPITVMFQPDAGPLQAFVLKDAEFTENPQEWTEGDMYKEIELPLIVSDIVKKI
jgi:hypothetical protein